MISPRSLIMKQTLTSGRRKNSIENFEIKDEDETQPDYDPETE
jgi:hypothetical protein